METIVGPTGRRTNKYIRNRKSKYPRPSAEELIKLLNKYGPIELAKKWKVSKVTVFSLMNHYGIESATTWKLTGKKVGGDLSKKASRE